MKFLVTWKIPTDKWHQVLKTFTSMSPKERVDAGPGVKIVGRWHDVSARSGLRFSKQTTWRRCSVTRCAGIHTWN